MTDGYRFAEHLLANQRQFADEMIKTATPLLPGRAGSKAIAAK